MFILKEIDDLYYKFSSKVYKENILDKKTKELIALACSVMADCVPCIHHHYKAAVQAGATKEEMAEAFAISMSVSSGSKQAKYTSVISELESDKSIKLKSE